ncbi:MAG: SDR family oxidoreductase [Deltaproteobacteria bacterium]|nr:SDR family oxidoreductase [Deltaproteobacteria bacterium]
MPSEPNKRDKTKAQPKRALTGKTVLVTGAAVRVGQAIALCLGEAGARVAVHHHQSHKPAAKFVEKLQSKGIESAAFAADLSDAKAPANLVSRVRAWSGQLDVLVNSAAIFGKQAFEKVERSTLDQLWALNFRAPYLLAQAALPMLKRSGGSIINILDVAAFSAWNGYSAYCPTKAALAMLTRNLAVELAPEVRVNAVAPGAVMFPKDYDESARQRVVEKIPLAREGSPLDVAKAVLYLATARYVTGAVIPVDGGRLAGQRGLL